MAQSQRRREKMIKEYLGEKVIPSGQVEDYVPTVNAERKKQLGIAARVQLKGHWQAV